MACWLPHLIVCVVICTAIKPDPKVATPAKRAAANVIASWLPKVDAAARRCGWLHRPDASAVLADGVTWTW